MGGVRGQQWFDYLEPPRASFSSTDEEYEDHFAVAEEGGAAGLAVEPPARVWRSFEDGPVSLAVGTWARGRGILGVADARQSLWLGCQFASCGWMMGRARDAQKWGGHCVGRVRGLRRQRDVRSGVQGCVGHQDGMAQHSYHSDTRPAFLLSLPCTSSVASRIHNGPPL